MVTITDEGALLVGVNRHNSNFDGTICKNASSYYKCGAQEYFRKNYCAKGIPECMDMRLFAEKDACIFKRIHPDQESEMQVFKKIETLVESGYNPIIFFYMSKQQGAQRVYPVVGAYIVKSIDIIACDYDRFEIKICPEEFIRIPTGVMQNQDLWRESTPTDSTWLRAVYKAEVISALEEIAKVTEFADVNEYGHFHSIAKKVIKSFDQEENLKLTKETHENSIAEKVLTELDLRKDISGKKELVHKSGFVDSVKTDFDNQVEEILKVSEAAGFYYSQETIKTICSSLAVNSLLVLAGISGSGKSSLATFYSQAIKGKLTVVAVRPDWTNPSHLLGVYNPFEKNFVATPVTKFICESQQEWDLAQKENRPAQPYVLLFDEMNLARVEYYFSDFLSKMQLPIPEMRILELYNEDEGNYPKKVRLTPNLKIIGTINIDETTFLFSPKVLDRASYINLNDIDINGLGKVIECRRGELHNLDIIREIVLPELQNLNFKLNELGQPFGYRTVWDIVKWVDYSLAVGNINNVYEGIDCQVERRVLIKITDSGKALLFNSLKGYFGDRTQRGTNLPIYEKCQQRLDELINRVMRDEYAVGQQY